MPLHHARWLRSEGRLDEAIAVLHEALAEDLRDADVVVTLAAMLAEQERFAEAETAFRHGFKLLGDDDPMLRLNHATFLAQSGELGRALGEVDALIEDLERSRAPDEPVRRAHLTRARIFLSLDEPAAARRDLARWIDDPQDWEHANDLLGAALQQVEPEVAFAWSIRNLERERPTVAEVEYLVGTWLMARDAPDEARAVVERAAAHLPIGWVRYGQLGELLAELGGEHAAFAVVSAWCGGADVAMDALISAMAFPSAHIDALLERAVHEIPADETEDLMWELRPQHPVPLARRLLFRDLWGRLFENADPATLTEPLRATVADALRDVEARSFETPSGYAAWILAGAVPGHEAADLIRAQYEAHDWGFGGPREHEQDEHTVALVAVGEALDEALALVRDGKSALLRASLDLDARLAFFARSDVLERCGHTHEDAALIALAARDLLAGEPDPRALAACAELVSYTLLGGDADSPCEDILYALHRVHGAAALPHWLGLLGGYTAETGLGDVLRQWVQAHPRDEVERAAEALPAWVSPADARAVEAWLEGEE